MEYQQEQIKSNISFCNKQTENIICNDFKKKILEQLYNNYQVSVSDRDLIILRKNFLNNLIKNKHYMTLKSFGNDYFLYLTKYNSNNVCFFIDTKIKQGFNFPRIIETKYRFSSHLFNNTLFKGELIRTNTNNWVYNIYDIIVCNGKKIIKKNIINKYELLFDILKNHYIRDQNLEVCPIMVRKIFEYNEINKLDIFVKKLPYKTKGIIFNPKNYNYNNLLYVFPYQKYNKIKKDYQNKKEENKIEEEQPNISYQPGIHFNIKHKPKKLSVTDKISYEEKINIGNYKKILVTFKISKTETPDIFDLSIFNQDLKTYAKYGIAHVQTLKISKLIKEIFKNNDQENILVDCIYSVNFNKWEPKKISKNKIANTIDEIKNKINQFL